MRNRLSTLLLALALPACSDASGVPDRPPRLHATEGVRIGSVDEEATAFGWVVRLAAADDGTIYTAHRGERSIRVFAPDGTPGTPIGRAGEGPGEFRGIDALDVRGDTLWVLDGGNRRVSFFDRRTGEVVGEAPAAMVEVEGRSASPFALLHDGSLLLRQYIHPEPVTPGSAPVALRLFRTDPAGGPPVSLLRLAQDDSRWAIEVDESFRAYAPYPFASHPLVAPSTHEPRIIVVERQPVAQGEGHGFRVTALDLDGDTIWSRVFEDAPLRMPVGLPDSLVEDMASRLAEGSAGMRARVAAAAREGLRVPDVLPPVGQLIVGGDGTIWLKREDAGRGVVDWWILDGNGDPLGVVELPAAARVLAARRNAVWGTVQDALDISHIVRWDLAAHAVNGGPPEADR